MTARDELRAKLGAYRSPRLIWTSDPTAIEHGELSFEFVLKNPLSGILLKLAAKRKVSPVELAADLFEGILHMVDCDLTEDEHFALMDDIFS